ncbi:MAG: protein-glutamate O-methyltransferase CheR [Beijerinckiaceae bacterium]|nr:protein-glutamate O-methyltransferase CheR [Beijerinckiaceae bacterium]
MSEPWFDSLRGLIEEATGVSIDSEKQYMAHARLTPLLARFGKTSLAELVSAAIKRQTATLSEAVIEAMMTGETFFFRDASLFEEIRKTILPELMTRRNNTRKLRIWCAACSTGQEPYSLAMMLDEIPAAARSWDIEILATDISSQALSRAKSGIYNQFEVQRGLPVTHLLKYFERYEDHWRLSASIRSRVSFATGNVLHRPSRAGTFDLVMCRYVLMYFSMENRKRAMRNVDQQLAPDGHLVLGTSESGIAQDMEYNSSPTFPSAFRKGDAGWETLPRVGTMARAANSRSRSRFD